MDTTTISVIVSSGVFCLSLYQAVKQDRLMKRTSELEVNVNRLNVQLDQSLKLLYHARDQAKALLHLFIITREVSNLTEDNNASLHTHVADLDALIDVVGNEKVKKIWREGIGSVLREHGTTSDDFMRIIMAGDMSRQTKQLLEGIYEMIRESTVYAVEAQPKLAERTYRLVHRWWNR